MREALGPGLDLRLQIECVLYAAGQMTQRFEMIMFLLWCEMAASFCQHQSENKKCGELRGERFGRRYANLGAGTGVKH